MPSASKMSTPVAVDLEVLQGRYAPLGGYTVAFETFKQDVDPAPVLPSACLTTAASASTGALSPKGRSRSGGPIGTRPMWPATPTTRRPAICPWSRRARRLSSSAPPRTSIRPWLSSRRNLAAAGAQQ